MGFSADPCPLPALFGSRLCKPLPPPSEVVLGAPSTLRLPPWGDGSQTALPVPPLLSHRLLPQLARTSLHRLAQLPSPSANSWLPYLLPAVPLSGPFLCASPGCFTRDFCARFRAPSPSAGRAVAAHVLGAPPESHPHTPGTPKVGQALLWLGLLNRDRVTRPHVGLVAASPRMHTGAPAQAALGDQPGGPLQLGRLSSSGSAPRPGLARPPRAWEETHGPFPRALWNWGQLSGCTTHRSVAWEKPFTRKQYHKIKCTYLFQGHKQDIAKQGRAEPTAAGSMLGHGIWPRREKPVS